MLTSTVSTISSRYQLITKRLNTDYYNSDSYIYHSIYVGSYGRDTEIYASDIDMLFELPNAVYHQYNNHQGNGQSALLQAVKESIKKTYSATDMKGDGQWKDCMSVPIKGMLIDTLAYQFLYDYAHKDKSFLYYDFMSRDFFEYLKNQEEKQSNWRAPGSGRYVENVDDFRYKAKRAYNISSEAIEKEKYESTAKSKWREIFGTKFPS